VAAPPGPEPRRDPRAPSSEPWTPWSVPTGPLNLPTAVRSAGTVAAPLLAGFSFTLAGLVLSLIPDGVVRWPDLALLLFVVAGFFLIACIQCAFWAERWNVTPDELTMWWPDADQNEGVRQYLYMKQAFHARRYDKWVLYVKVSYNYGIVAFLLAVAVLLIPPGPFEKMAGLRVIAISTSLVALIAELVWVATSGRRAAKEQEHAPRASSE